MKIHPIVYLPVDVSKITNYVIVKRNPSEPEIPVEKKENLILLSREQAEAVFDAGFKHGMDLYASMDAGDDCDPNIPDKEQYFNKQLNNQQ